MGVLSEIREASGNPKHSERSTKALSGERQHD